MNPFDQGHIFEVRLKLGVAMCGAKAYENSKALAKKIINRILPQIYYTQYRVSYSKLFTCYNVNLVHLPSKAIVVVVVCHESKLLLIRSLQI